jgi:glycosyltransferase involved in cell wall biosynthesis
MSTRLSIVVPCYNEAANLPLVFAAFRDALQGRPGVEVVLVENGSTDDSAAVFATELALAENAFARVVRVPVNQGYGHGILSGLRQARGEFLAWTHADLQTDPADVLRGFDLLARQPQPERCFVRGRRRGRPLFDRIFTAGMSAVASLLLWSRLRDVNAQPKIFHRSLLAHLDAAPWDFALDLYVLHRANRLGLTVLEQPVCFGKRRHGEAKGGGSLRGKLRLTRRTLACIWKLRWRGGQVGESAA